MCFVRVCRMLSPILIVHLFSFCVHKETVRPTVAFRLLFVETRLTNARDIKTHLSKQTSGWLTPRTIRQRVFTGQLRYFTNSPRGENFWEKNRGRKRISWIADLKNCYNCSTSELFRSSKSRYEISIRHVKKKKKKKIQKVIQTRKHDMIINPGSQNTFWSFLSKLMYRRIELWRSYF